MINQNTDSCNEIKLYNLSEEEKSQIPVWYWTKTNSTLDSRREIV